MTRNFIHGFDRVDPNQMALIEKVLRDHERKKLIKDSKPLLLSNLKHPDGTHYPGKQTLTVMKGRPEFEPILNHMVMIIRKTTGMDLVINKAWVNCTNGNKKDMVWHTHPCDIAAVYYMKTFPFFSNGTLFRNGLIKAPQNSLLLFSAALEHTAPSSPLPFSRYTLSMDLDFRNKIRVYDQDYS